VLPFSLLGTPSARTNATQADVFVGHVSSLQNGWLGERRDAVNWCVAATAAGIREGPTSVAPDRRWGGSGAGDTQLDLVFARSGQSSPACFPCMSGLRSPIICPSATHMLRDRESMPW
jgi:hypothetical protein